MSSLLDTFGSKRFAWIALAAGQAALILGCAFAGIWVPAAIVGCLCVWRTLKRPFLGVLLIVLLQVFVVKGNKGMSIAEVGVGLYLFLFLLVWFFNAHFIRFQPILEHRMDAALFLFFGFCVFSLVPGLLEGVSLMKWARELIPFIPLLLLFPLRRLLTTKKRIYWLMAAVLALCLFSAGRNLFRYRSAVAIAEVYWQLAASRQTSNEPLFFVPIVVSMGVFLFSSSRRTKIAMAVLVSLFSVALIVTFSRGYWVATVLAMVLFYVFSPHEVKRRALVYLGLLLGASSLIAVVFFGGLAKLIFDSVFGRMATIGSVLVDPSIKGRIREAEALVGYIRENPVLGYGLGKYYSFISLFPREMPTDYVHNAFLFLLFKVGIAGFVSYLLFFLAGIAEGFRAYRMQTDETLKAVVLGITCFLIAMLPLSLSSPQFYQKDSVLLIVIGIAIVFACGNLDESAVRYAGR
jgi:O-antigen ligase